MNYLAHIYLSGDDEMITIGNFMADGIRGKKYLNYEPLLQIGILLHRQIDTFTDAHPTVRKSTKRLHKNYSHYASVIVDIFYDHYLAKNWSKYSKTPLAEYAENFYDSLKRHKAVLPDRTLHLMPYMIANNWLLSYASIDGIAQVLNGMNRRTKYRSGMNKAVNELQKFYHEFESEFFEFFDELIPFSKEKLKIVSSQIK